MEINNIDDIKHIELQMQNEALEYCIKCGIAFELDLDSSSTVMCITCMVRTLNNNPAFMGIIDRLADK